MANTANARGLVPVRYRNGSPWDGKATPYYIGTGLGTAVFIGDPVVVDGSANASDITHVGGRFRPGSLASVTLATAGDANRITGVVTGFMMIHRDSTVYREASTERIALVCDDPNVVFQVQDDGSGSGLGITNVSQNANLVAGGGGSTATGMSSWALDATTPNTNNTYQVRILGMSNLIDRENNVDEDYITWDVIINNHTYAPVTAGV